MFEHNFFSIFHVPDVKNFTVPGQDRIVGFLTVSENLYRHANIWLRLFISCKMKVVKEGSAFGSQKSCANFHMVNGSLVIHMDCS